MAGSLGLPTLKTFSPYIQFILSLSILIINRIFFVKGINGLKNKAPGMDTLISLGAAAAFLYSTIVMIISPNSQMLYFESSGMIFTLITLGKMLEANSKAHTMDAINSLSDLTVGKVTVLRDGEERIVTTEAVRTGDVVYIYEGQRICADGTVIFGTGSVDKSALTGESVPEDVSIDSKVLSGSMCTNGFFKFKVEKAGKETVLYSIIELVKEASRVKAPVARLADKISGYFVPIVTFISIVTFVLWMVLGHDIAVAVNFAISVLVISCPCALGLATPAAMMAATGNAAANKILVRSSESLETAGKTDTVVLDKTGTLTEGKLSVTDAFCWDKNMLKTYVLMAASLEKESSHPYSVAIKEYGKLQYPGEEEAFLCTNIEMIPGGGIKGRINDDTYIIGNESFMIREEVHLSEDVIETSSMLQQEGKTVLFMAGQKICLVLGLTATIKDSAYKALQRFKNDGLEIILATGDSKITAEAIAKKLPIDKVYSEILPNEKYDIIDELQKAGKKVAMIGDGINDAPALVKADIGIALGCGADIAIDSGDFILMRDSLMDAYYAVSLSRRTMKIIKQNLFWAFFYNIIGIPIAAGALFVPFGIKLTPAIAALCMSLSSLFVVTNALRLRGTKNKLVRN